MKHCDLCQKPAVVHEVVIRNGVTSEVHLCAEHAVAKGFQVPSAPLAQTITQLVEQTGLARKGRRTGACPGCGLTIVEFRQTGVLGCPSCYDAFQPDLGTLIERAQAGATHHVGRSPARALAGTDRILRRQRLVQELDAAVAAEQYERAARLRDRLHDLDADDGESPL